jgi:flagellin-like protein
MWGNRSADGDGRGVSPVVGTVLLLAIVLVLAGSSAVLFTDFAGSLSEPAPQATFDTRLDTGGNLTVRHAGGDSFAAERAGVVVSDPGGTVSERRWSDYAGATTVRAESGITVRGLDGDETVTLVWYPESGGSTPIADWDVSSVPAAVSPADVASGTSWAVNDPEFQNGTAWKSVARAGSRSANGDWELGIGEDVSGNLAATEQHGWSNGESVPFTLRYDAEGNGDAELLVDGRSVAVDASGFDTGNTVGITLNSDSADWTVNASDLRLNGNPLSKTSQSAAGQNTYVLLTEEGVSEGFVLTGDVELTWSGTPPSGSEVQLHFEVEGEGGS